MTEPFEPRLILSLDQSTTASKAMIFRTGGAIVARADVPHEQHYPRQGWVEHDPNEILENCLIAIREAAAAVDPSDLAAIGITNQRETVVVWERRSGRPVYPAVVWQCLRGAELTERMRAGGNESLIRERTGLLCDPYFSASKIAWILDNVEGARRRANSGELLFGTIDSWLVWNLTKHHAHVTDASNASRTMLFNLHSLEWDDDLLRLFDIPRSMCPRLVFSDEVVGETDAAGALPRTLPVAGLLGDSHAAFLSQGCFEIGEAKATYGTGTSMMMNIGEHPADSGGRLVTSVGWRMRERACFVFEGNIHSSGDTIKWLVDGLRLIPDAGASESIANEVADAGGVHLVPAFAGLGAPRWDSGARASITGISRSTGRAHVVRAALEGIAFQVCDLVEAMELQSGRRMTELRADGGASANRLLMQIQADLLGAPVVVTDFGETSALGAAIAAGIAVGLVPNLGSVRHLGLSHTRFEPRISDSERRTRRAGWEAAVSRTLSR